MKSFDSCSAFEDVMETYMKSYWENNYQNRDYRFYGEPVLMEMSVQEESLSLDSLANKSTADSAE
tara:strand:+ start:195 stop:389 length:195 start_codon:yes stop_codon:yes gene_type:complete